MFLNKEPVRRRLNQTKIVATVGPACANKALQWRYTGATVLLCWRSGETDTELTPPPTLERRDPVGRMVRSNVPRRRFVVSRGPSDR